MNTIRRIAKNSFVLLLAEIISGVLGFLYIMYAARYLGAKDFGVLYFAVAFTGIFGVLINFGLFQLTIREVARDKALARKYLGNIFAIKLVLSAITLGLIILTINLLGYPEKTIKVVYIFAIVTILTAFSDVFEANFQAFERMEFYSIRKTLSSILLVSGALFAIQQGYDVIGFALIYLLISIIILAYSSIISAWKFVTPTIEIDFDFWKSSLKEAWPFGLTILFVTVYYQIDTVMLSLMKDDVVVGWYNAAYRPIFGLLFVPLAFSTAIFPVMSRFYISSRDSLRLTHEKFFKYMVILSVPVGTGIMILADKIILIIFGSEYLPSIIALQILIWAAVFVFASSAYGRLFESLNKQMIVTKVTGISAILNVVLNLLLIPKYSYIGASVTTVATQFTVFLLFYGWSLKLGYSIPRKKLINISSKVIVSSGVMGLFIKIFEDISLVGLVPSAVLIYLAVLYIIQGFDKEDGQIFKSLVKG